MKTLAWAGCFIISLYVAQIFMHLFNMDGTAGLGDLSGKEITKEHVESGRVGSDIILHVSAREGMFHLTILMIMLNICWSGFAKQKLCAVAVYYAFIFGKLMLKFLVPWNGEHPTNMWDYGMPIQAVKSILLHPCVILGAGVYLDDDIWEYFGLDKGEKV